MISPLAYVDSAARLGKDVTVQPFAYIEGDVEIGDECVIMSGARILDGTRMGKQNTVHHGAVLGSTPQDFRFKGEESRLVIGDKNDIRENVVIARATHKEGGTRVGNGNYLMDGAHLCHDVQVGNDNVLGIRSMMAGESSIGNCSILSSGVIIQQHARIGNWALIMAGCRISKDVPPYVIMEGNPATYHGVNAFVLRHKNEVEEKVLRHIMNSYRMIFSKSFSVDDALLKIEDQVPMSDEIRHIIDFVRGSNGIMR